MNKGTRILKKVLKEVQEMSIDRYVDICFGTETLKMSKKDRDELTEYSEYRDERKKDLGI